MPSTEPGKPRPGVLARIAAALGLGALSACHSPMPPDAGRAPAAAPPRAAAAPAPAAPYQRPAATADEYKLQIASKLVAANPSITYMARANDRLLAIPILEIEVNADGSVRRIEVVRRPKDADVQDTVQIAIDAVRRAAPFGDVTHVPKPWKFTEVFLFDDDKKFKPRVLD